MVSKFKATLDDPDLLKNSINTVSNLLNEGNFILKKDGFELKSMDSANVAMVDLKMLSSAFKEYDLENEETIGVNIVDLTSVLRRADSTSPLTIALDDNTLSITMQGKTKRNFKIPLLDIRNESKDLNLKFPASIEVSAEVLESGISDAEIVSDAITLEADPDKFVMRAESENRQMSLELEKGNDALTKLEVNDHVKSTFPLDYMKKMIKASKLADKVAIGMGNDYPMRIDFKVIDKLLLGFVLAPRIESE